MIRGIIYKWTNLINNKVYVGKTINEKRRYREHLHYKKREENLPIHKALKKYGYDNFKYEVVFETRSNNKDNINTILNALEKHYIRKFNSNNKKYGYNLTKGGEGTLGYKLTDEERKIRSERMKGENNPMFGGNFSEEHLRKLRLARGNKTIHHKNVIQLSLDGEPIKEFPSAKKAAEFFGSVNNRSNITKACKQGRRAFGYRWRYA